MKNLKDINILVVDDEPLQSMMTCLVLEKYGFRPISSHSGEDSVLKVNQYPEISLVLMDIELGQGINGIEASKQILAIKDLPIVFHSGYSDITIFQKIQNVKRYGFVMKSSGEHILISTLETALELFNTKKKLNETNTIFDLISRNIKEIFWIEDPLTNKLIYITPSVEKIFGISIEEMQTNKLKFLDSVYIDDVENVKTEYQNALMMKKFVSFEYRVINQKGDIFWLQARLYPITNEENSIIKIVGFAEDITEMKSVSNSLKEKSKLLDLQFEQMPIISMFCDLEFNVLRWNHMCEKVFGYTESQVIGKYILPFIVAPEDLAKVKTIPDLINNETKTLEFTNKNIDKDGNLILCNWYNTIVRDEKGKLLGLICNAIDITNILLSEESNLKLLQEKEVLLKEVHHRVKNNMATISSLLYLEESEITEENAKASLQEARNRIMSMMIIYEKLFDSNSFDKISLMDYLNSLISELKITYPISHAKILFEFEDVQCVTNVLYPIGIITNELLTNCYKHAFPIPNSEGRIFIHGALLERNIYQLSVEDNGIGFDPESLSKSKPTFGMKLIDILTLQINGKLTNTKADNSSGTKTLIQFQV